MDADLIQMMRRLAPDLTEEMTRRALILERISALQPVGRRQLAARLNLPEREIRNAAALLRELGYVSLDPSGMNLTPRAGAVLEAVEPVPASHPLHRSGVREVCVYHIDIKEAVPCVS